MADKLLTIATFWEPWEAHLVKAKLDEHGIKSFLSGENFVATYWLCANAEGGIKLKVAESDAARASQILEANEKTETKQIAAGSTQTHGENDVCPKCQSADIEYERFSRKVFFLSILLLRFPLPFFSNRYKCQTCGHTWR
jgi:hypothetical protein